MTTVIDDTRRALMTKAKDFGREFDYLISGLGKSNEIVGARRKIQEAIELIIKHLKS